MTRSNSPLAPESGTPPAGGLSYGEDEDRFEIEFYQKSPLRRCFCIFLYLITGGSFFLLLHWMPKLWSKINLRQTDPKSATIVIIRSAGESWAEDVHSIPYSIIKEHSDWLTNEKSDQWETSIIAFEFKKQKYLLLDENRIHLVTGLENVTTEQMLRTSNGLTDISHHDKNIIYGRNEITVQVPRIFQILISEILNPFYVFQVFSVILWFIDEYHYYACSIVIITTFSMVTTLRAVRKERKNLQQMVEKHNSTKVHCLRNSEWIDVWSRDLVPGDVIHVPPGGCTLPADCCLLTGECIVDEGMLTGESIPVIKSPLKATNRNYIPEEDRNVTLFGGTTVLQTRTSAGTKCTGMVVRTGYQTARGRLVQSILFPKQIDMKLQNDAINFVGLMGIIALIGFSYSVIMQYYGCVSVKDIITKSLDVLTIVVPPALPAALAVGITYAQTRLKKKNIFTVSPKRINLCGSVSICLFDKTGTLTEDGLEYLGVCDASDFDGKIKPSAISVAFKHALAACHSLTKINGELNGDPLELEMLKSTGWVVTEPNENENDSSDNLNFTKIWNPNNDDKTEIHHMRQFPFSSEEARQTVLIRKLNQSEGTNQLMTLMKGSPEKIAKMVRDLPVDYFEKLDELTRQGYRVIALAEAFPKLRALKALKAQREVLEENASFLGFLILQNKIKTETKPVLKEILNAGIRCIMVTGDNILTAICVGREAGLLSGKKVFVASIDQSDPNDQKLVWRENNKLEEIVQLRKADFEANDFYVAMTGDTFEWIIQYQSHMIPYILIKGTIFARMSPDNKASLVDKFENLDFVCCFCGDGANDCAALKRASVGISLSELEASVASPFTSKEPNIQCVSKLIKEGRCALMTTFGMFKYMALYSMIQFCSILILYWRVTNLSDWQYLYIDLVMINLVALTMSLNKPSNQISRITPPRALITAPTIFSLAAHLIICVSFQIIVYFYTNSQPWFCSLSDNSPPCFDGGSKGIILSNPNNGTISTFPNRFNLERCEILDENWEDREVIVTTHMSAAIFFFSCYQYVIMAFVFSVGEPFRQPVTKNLLFLASLVGLIIITSLILLTDNFWLQEQFQVVYIFEQQILQIPPVHQNFFRLMLIIIAFVNFLVAIFVEHYIAENRKFWSFWKRFQTLRHKNKKYMAIEDFVNANEYWPPQLPDSASLKTGIV